MAGGVATVGVEIVEDVVVVVVEVRLNANACVVVTNVREDCATGMVVEVVGMVEVVRVVEVVGMEAVDKGSWNVEVVRAVVLWGRSEIKKRRSCQLIT